MVALATWAAPLSAQSGLASARTTVALSAIKTASIGVSLAEIRASRPAALPLLIATTWDLDPRCTATVALVAVMHSPARVERRTPAGGPKRLTRSGGAAGMVERPVVFVQPIAAVNAASRRTDELRPKIELTRTLQLLVTTQ